VNAGLGAAYVTGGSSGIGLAVARALLDRGHPVSICGRDAAKLDRAAAELAAAEGMLFAAVADVSRREDAERWIRDAAERLGPPAVLVLNAGIAHYGDIASTTDDEWNETLAVNLTGPFLVVRAALPLMRRAGGGYVVSISSLAGKRGMPNTAAYSASKFGLAGLTESLLRREAPNAIRATTICPGFVATPMVAGASTPVEEMAQPEDIAKTIVWLLELSPHVVIREVVVERTGAL
jgi:3-oxoacyl-[acyl-carrier protein] reductase